jgi:uncharacterized protein (DUF362 family)
MPAITRRSFLVRAGQAGLGSALLLSGCAAAPVASQPAPAVTASGGPPPDLAVIRGANPAALTRRAVQELGGIGRFVKPGQRVLIKPNICVSLEPKYAATTNPEVVATLVTLCREAGAGKVVVMDYGFQGQTTSYKVSGIEDAVKAAGGEMQTLSLLKYKKTPIPLGKKMKEWPIHEDALTADVLINVPIAKHHFISELTLSMKNMMGVVDFRTAFHSAIDQYIVDINTVLKANLIVMDAVRILLRNGPNSGILEDGKDMNTVIAATDPVATDAYAASKFFGMKGEKLGYVRLGAETGLGVMDLSKLRVAELSL